MQVYVAPLRSLSRRALVSTVALGGLCLASAGCATTGAGTGGTAQNATPAAAPWAPMELEHVDLWLHGYAMLTRDTATVPLFERGYRERMQALKNSRNVYSSLDANQDQLAARIAVNPALVNGQFVPLYFSSWDQLTQIVGLFIQAQGNPRAATDEAMATLFAVLGGSFPTAADRDWLRLFVQSLADERARFYHDYWIAEQSARAPVLTAVEAIWQGRYLPRLQSYLRNTQQASGDLILSLPLDGEGRTVTAGRYQNAITIGFPDSPAEANEVVFDFAHESIIAVTNTAIADNTTPAEQRSGAANQYAANAPVRGGALLLQRVAPELVSGYMRYYLRSAGATAPSGDPTSAFVAKFPLPTGILDAISRQLNIVLGGI